MKVSRDYIGNLIQHRKTQSLYEKRLIGTKRAVYIFSNRQWGGGFDPRNPPPPRAYATACNSLDRATYQEYLTIIQFQKPIYLPIAY